MVSYIYLHGFASSPNSAKAKALGDRFRARQLPYHSPDLNQGDFTHLTLSRQLQQVAALLPPALAPVVIIGSSFGGLTAAWLGERHAQIERLVLLAPAFGFLDHWLPKLGEARLTQWQHEGLMPVYHYAEQHEVPLHYDFVSDAAQYRDEHLQRPVPTLILHGIHDEVVPIQASRDFMKHRPWVQLIELDSDHALGNVTDEIWQATQAFCALE